ncbi:MAG TPA: asparaginase [Thermoleophilaceae bacterium]
MARPLVQLVATGGTIAMTGSPARPALSGDELVAAVPEIGEIAELRVLQLSNVPGVNLDPSSMARALNAAWEAVKADGAAGAVITQGTDTIEETAELARLTWDREEPLVITGAIRTGGSTGSDGPLNLLDAVRFAAAPEARGLGPAVVFDGVVHAAGEVVKSHSWRSDAFDSEAPLAEVREGRVRWLRAMRRDEPLASAADLAAKQLDAHVPIVAAAAGMDGRLLEHEADALVVIALGAGHLPESMLPALDRALGAGTPVVVCARPAAGGTLESTYGFVGSETDLAERGVILAGAASPWKARIRVLVALALGRGPRGLFTDR